MPQCKAETASHARCASEVSSPSRSLCTRHQNILIAGKTVVNFDTGRTFPMPAARSAAPKAAPRAKIATAPASDQDATRAPRGPGEHALVCDAARCGERALAGSDYCMKHQGLA